MYKVPLLSIDIEDLGKALFIDYDPNTDSINIEHPNVGSSYYITGIFSKVASTFEWISFSMSYNILKGRSKFLMTDSNENVLVNAEYKGIPKDSKYPKSKYSFTFGFSNGKIPPFEIGGFEFFDVNVIDEISQFKVNIVTSPKVGCYHLVYGACYEKMEDTINLIPSNSKYLFYPIVVEPTNYYTFDHYLITLEVDLSKYKNSGYSANPKTLFVFSDDETNMDVLKINDVILLYQG